MMDFVEKYLIKTNIWVAVCFASLLAFFQLILYRPNFYVLGIVFFGTLAIYNFSRIGNLQDRSLTPFHFVRNDKDSKILYTKNKNQILLTIIGLIGTLVCVVLRGFEMMTFLYLFVLGFMSFCYSLPFSGLGLRTIPFLKLFLIAFVWAGSSIGLLLVVHHSLIQHQLLFFSVFFFVIGITIPFDIRDRNLDEKGLKTIPQVLGVIPSKIFSVLSLVLSFFLFYFEFNKLNSGLISWSIASLIAIILVVNSSEKRSETYYSFWMESCSVIPLVIYLIF